MESKQKITERLEGAGWSREPATARLNWPEFGFKNGKAELEFLYSRRNNWVRLGLLTESEEGYLQVHFGQALNEFLDVLVSAQDDLDGSGWSDFIEKLLKIPVKVYAITGENEDDLVELRTMGDGPAPTA
ncbi:MULTISPECIES: hypothetical protein [unclassified Streptomyces]|uniref:hypothetical protein n=1 Tax=Streptomyces sp. NPDC127532 TaxID=3345399 RepID=UPI00363BB3DC